MTTPSPDEQPQRSQIPDGYVDAREHLDVDHDAERLAPGTLAQLTAVKALANTALRWIPPFLPTLEKAFGASTTQLTTVLGLGEAAGFSTVLIGPQLDKGRERLVLIGGISTISASAVIALGGTLWTFAISFVLLILGVANLTVAGHAWISHRVDFRWRARSIGVFETSWAIALLVGGPVVAILINLFGWRGPFVAIAVSAGVTALVLSFTLPPTDARTGGPALEGSMPTRKAWLLMFGSALMAASGLSVFIISGSWLDDAFGVSTGGLGVIVMGFGGIELLASTSTAAFADRIGKMRSTLAGLIVLGVGLVIMLSAGDRLAIGVLGVLTLLLGFEYGFVTSLSLVSEAMPGARGKTLALSNAIGTVARGSGTITSGWLYGRHGIGGTAALSATIGTVALICFVLSRRVD